MADLVDIEGETQKCTFVEHFGIVYFLLTIISAYAMMRRQGACMLDFHLIGYEYEGKRGKYLMHTQHTLLIS